MYEYYADRSRVFPYRTRTPPIPRLLASILTKTPAVLEEVRLSIKGRNIDASVIPAFPLSLSLPHLAL